VSESRINTFQHRPYIRYLYTEYNCPSVIRTPVIRILGWSGQFWANYSSESATEIIIIVKVKGKRVKQSSLQGLTGPEGSRRLGLPDFKTIGTWRRQCQPYVPAAFTPRKYSWYSFLLEAESRTGSHMIGPQLTYFIQTSNMASCLVRIQQNTGSNLGPETDSTE